jgi:hypothetical protein
MSKGDKPRPMSVPREEYDDRWDATLAAEGLNDWPPIAAVRCPACNEEVADCECDPSLGMW